MNLNWKQIMQTVEGDDRFYMDTEEDEVTPKEAGWEFLRMHGKDDDVDEESEEESVYSENSKQDESVSPALFFLLMSNLIKPSLLDFSLNSRTRNLKKRTLTSMRMMSLISTVTRILKSKAWIGMTWKEKQLRMIARRRGMGRRLLIPGPRDNLVVRPKMI